MSIPSVSSSSTNTSSIGSELQWSTHESLLLCHAVVRYGENDWNEIANALQSRSMTSAQILVGRNMPTTKTFSAEKCAKRYKALLENELPGMRTPPIDGSGLPDADGHHDSALQIVCERLRQTRIDELKRAIKDKEGYSRQQRQEMELIAAGHFDPQLVNAVQQIQKTHKQQLLLQQQQQQMKVAQATHLDQDPARQPVVQDTPEARQSQIPTSEASKPQQPVPHSQAQTVGRERQQVSHISTPNENHAPTEISSQIQEKLGQTAAPPRQPQLQTSAQSQQQTQTQPQSQPQHQPLVHPQSQPPPQQIPSQQRPAQRSPSQFPPQVNSSVQLPAPIGPAQPQIQSDTNESIKHQPPNIQTTPQTAPRLDFESQQSEIQDRKQVESNPDFHLSHPQPQSIPQVQSPRFQRPQTPKTPEMRVSPPSSPFLVTLPTRPSPLPSNKKDLGSLPLSPSKIEPERRPTLTMEGTLVNVDEKPPSSPQFPQPETSTISKPHTPSNPQVVTQEPRGQVEAMEVQQAPSDIHPQIPNLPKPLQPALPKPPQPALPKPPTPLTSNLPNSPSPSMAPAKAASFSEKENPQPNPQLQQAPSKSIGESAILATFIKEFRKNPYARHFLQPVADKDAPDYDEVIEKRMDISTIQKKVNQKEIVTREQMVKHLDLIFQNAIAYNDPSSTVYQNSKKFQKAYRKELENAYETATEKPGPVPRITRSKGSPPKPGRGRPPKVRKKKETPKKRSKRRQADDTPRRTSKRIKTGHH